MTTQVVLDDTFDSIVLQSQGLVLVDFWAEWCGPCKAIAPTLEEISDELAGQVIIAKLDVDGNPLTPSKYNVRGIPTLILFKDGVIVDTKIGGLPKTQLIGWINTFINL